MSRRMGKRSYVFTESARLYSGSSPRSSASSKLRGILFRYLTVRPLSVVSASPPRWASIFVSW